MTQIKERTLVSFDWAMKSYQDEIQSAEQKGEQNKALIIPRQMLTHGEPLDKIKLYTGLSADEITQLQSPSR